VVLQGFVKAARHDTWTAIWLLDFNDNLDGMRLLKQLFIRWRLPIVALLALAMGISVATQLISTMELLKACAFPDDATRGRKWARTCKGCHDIAASQPATATPGMRSSGGPNLQNVYGSLAGTAPAPFRPTGRNHPFPPLAAAHDAGIIWTDENLFEYLRGPKRFLEERTGKSFSDGLYMGFFIGREDERRDVIAYLKAIKGRPECN
jgi:cytochrome c